MDEITPYKFSSTVLEKKNFLNYRVPKSSKFSIPQHQENDPNITFYMSKPKHKNKFPIVILCGGSSTENSINSIIHLHRYFLQEFLDLGVGLITVEQWGVSDDKVNPSRFIQYYTTTQRFLDHKTVINHLMSNPPTGWNGKFIFVGISEGGALVTRLTTEHPNITLATLNWSGANEWNWREELWEFLEGMRNSMLSQLPWHVRIRGKLPRWFPYSIDIRLPKTRDEFDQIMNQTLKNPTYKKQFVSMTYKYHADMLTWPKNDYQKIKSPYLLVAGAKDTLIKSSDDFARAAQKAGVKITYLRVPDMDHYVRRRSDILDKSFNWLRDIIKDEPKINS
jgi:pimeloyl-ACP methyl ester carboxylesterase